MSALRRVRNAPDLVALCLLTLWLPATGIAGFTEGAIASTMNGYSVDDSDALLAPTFEILGAMPGFSERIFSVITSAGLWISLLWLVLAAGVFMRLHRPLRISKWVAAGIAGAPSIIGVTAWHWLLRLIAVGALAALAQVASGLLSSLSVLVLVAIWLYCVCALDIARCRVALREVERETRPVWWHPAPALRALREVQRHPTLLMRSAVLCATQWACLLVGTWLVVTGMGLDHPIWIARLLAFVAALLGLLRWATTVDILSRAGVVGSSQ